MKLLIVISVTLALSLAYELEANFQQLEDLESSASSSVVSQQSQDYNLPIANKYNYVPSTVAPQNLPTNYNIKPTASLRNYYAPQDNFYQPESGYNNQYNNNGNYQNSWNNPQPSQPSNSWSSNGWNQQSGSHASGAQNSWNHPQNTGSQNSGAQNSWNQPQNSGSHNIGAQNSWNKPQNSWNNPQSSGSQNAWNQNVPSTPSTTTPVSVIKNEQIIGDNGSYKYEYQIADGTHVAEEGYLVNPNTDKESVVKKGFYSFTGADGKVYSVTYWADETGFHAVGDHLPKPHPIPPAIQASIDQNAKEEAAKAEAEKKKQQQQQHQIYYPQAQEPPKPLVPQQPIHAIPQPSYPQQQQVFYPPQNYYQPQGSYPSQSYGK